MAVCFTCPVIYLSVVNDFYAFYKLHSYSYPDGFKSYLSEARLKERLSLNPHDDLWYLATSTTDSG